MFNFVKTAKEIIVENYSKSDYPEEAYITLEGLSALEGMLYNMLSITCERETYQIMEYNIRQVFEAFKKENEIKGSGK